MSSHASAGRSHCLNCGAPLSGPYCSACGQHDVDYHRSLWPILEDSLEGMLNFDGKFFQTVRWLFTRPGFLTKEFIAGRRVSYTQPLRLYIFASFLYFASILALQQPPAHVGVTSKPSAAEVQDASETGGADTATRQEGAIAGKSFFARMGAKLTHVDRKELGSEIRHLTPTMAFFCLPFLAMVLAMVYSGSGRVYVEHMIFALHVQAFFFLANLSSDLVRAALRLVSVPLADLAGVVFFLGGVWLVYRAFRVVYGQGAWKTVLKMALVGSAYGIILTLGITLTAVTAALLVSENTPVAG